MKDGWDGERRAGFTIIEVMLFLAISGFLLVGILAGTGSGIARQRYNDSVQDFAQTLREQYSAVINTQIAARDVSSADACYSPAPDDVMSGGGIDAGRLGSYYDSEGNLKINAGRGRTSCLVYGVMVMFGGNGGRTVQTSTLIGKDIEQLVRDDPELKEQIEEMHDIDILREAGVNNLNVFYETNGSTSVSEWRCWVRTTSGSGTHNLQWDARAEETRAAESVLNPNNVLNATALIIRSPKDGSIRTYIWKKSIEFNGGVVDYAAVDSRNDGKGYGLLAEDDGKCNGAVGAGNSGYRLLMDASVNRFLTKDNFKNTGTGEEAMLNICVGSGDIFAFDGKRRMIRLARDGHNAGAVELLSADEQSGNGGSNLCQ